MVGVAAVFLSYVCPLGRPVITHRVAPQVSTHILAAAVAAIAIVATIVVVLIPLVGLIITHGVIIVTIVIAQIPSPSWGFCTTLKVDTTCTRCLSRLM